MEKDLITVFWIAVVLVPIAFFLLYGGMFAILVTILAVLAVLTHRSFNIRWLLVPHFLLGVLSLQLTIRVIESNGDFKDSILNDPFLSALSLWFIGTALAILFCLLNTRSVKLFAFRISAYAVICGLCYGDDYFCPYLPIIIFVSFPVVIVNMYLACLFIHESVNKPSRESLVS